MYDGMKVYRAIVTAASYTTGEIRVKIPSILGDTVALPITFIGRAARSTGLWEVPNVGDQVLVAVEDERLSNIFLVKLDNEGTDTLPTNEPIGFTAKSDSSISFNNSTRTFTIQPVSTSFDVWCKGVKFTKKSAETVTLPNTSGIYYIYYDAYGVLNYKTTFFSLSQEAPVAYVYWNATDGVQYFFADERHGITMDWATHEYLHLTRGAALSSGLSLQSFTTSGTGSASTDATVSIANGTFYDEDIPIAITHSATPVANSWQQRLQGGAYIPVYYKTGTGVWKADTATQYPLKFSTLATYNQLSGTWSATALANTKFGIYWIVATNNLNEPIISIMGQAEYNTVGAAEAALWSDMDLSGLPIIEFRTLYKLVYQTSTSYSNAVKSRLVSATDFRASASMVSGSVASPPMDHGFLSGLADDDHTQYHTDARGDARYLQLTGGTLSGTLNGTAAVFSGNVSGASAGFGPTTLTGALSGTSAVYSGNISGASVTANTGLVVGTGMTVTNSITSLTPSVSVQLNGRQVYLLTESSRVSASASLTLTTTPTLVPGLTYTTSALKVNDIVDIFFSVYVQNSNSTTAGSATMTPYIGGLTTASTFSVLGAAMTSPATSVGAIISGNHRQVIGSAGTKTIEIRGSLDFSSWSVVTNATHVNSMIVYVYSPL